MHGLAHAGSQTFHVCTPALKCHLEERVDGWGAEKGLAKLPFARLCQACHFNITWAHVHVPACDFVLDRFIYRVLGMEQFKTNRYESIHSRLIQFSL